MLAVLLAVQASLLPRAVQTGMGLGLSWLAAISCTLMVIWMPRPDVRMWGMPLRWAMAGVAAVSIVFAVLKTIADLG